MQTSTKIQVYTSNYMHAKVSMLCMHMKHTETCTSKYTYVSVFPFFLLVFSRGRCSVYLSPVFFAHNTSWFKLLVEHWHLISPIYRVLCFPHLRGYLLEFAFIFCSHLFFSRSDSFNTIFIAQRIYMSLSWCAQASSAVFFKLVFGGCSLHEHPDWLICDTVELHHPLTSAWHLRFHYAYFWLLANVLRHGTVFRLNLPRNPEKNLCKD